MLTLLFDGVTRVCERGDWVQVPPCNEKVRFSYFSLFDIFNLLKLKLIYSLMISYERKKVYKDVYLRHSTISSFATTCHLSISRLIIIVD